MIHVLRPERHFRLRGSKGCIRFLFGVASSHYHACRVSKGWSHLLGIERVTGSGPHHFCHMPFLCIWKDSWGAYWSRIQRHHRWLSFITARFHLHGLGKRLQSRTHLGGRKNRTSWCLLRVGESWSLHVVWDTQRWCKGGWWLIHVSGPFEINLPFQRH